MENQNAQSEEQPEYEYAGFWVRTGACLVDSLFFLLILLPITFYGAGYLLSDRLFRGPVDIVINWIMPAVLTVILWRGFQATPGKMALRLRVQDVESGCPASTGQYICRYLGNFVSTVPLGLGFFWIAFDRRKKGWHDKLAGTVV
ncbi:RDD family protein [Salmonella enterica]|nr:RDD family protein [Salmonella enterica]